MKVKFKKVNPAATVPTKAHQEDAGFDLTATSRRMDVSGFIEFGTGIAAAIPSGHVGLVFPRSSISKVNMTLANSVGVIDSNYRGEILIRFKPAMAGKGIYEVGDRVAQLVIIPYPEIEFEEVDDLDATDRGEGGFGSTGDKEITVIDAAGMVHKGTKEEIENGTIS